VPETEKYELQIMQLSLQTYLQSIEHQC